MQVLSRNEKTGYSLNFPIEHTCDKSCPFYQDKTCYGMKGRFVFSNYRRAEERRWEMFTVTPERFYDALSDDIRKAIRRGVDHIRINGIGDTPSLEAARHITYRCGIENAYFWVATRKLFWQDVPKSHNLVVRYSDGISAPTSSAVVEAKADANCPATTGLVKNCKECGFKCWDEGNHITYARH